MQTNSVDLRTPAQYSPALGGLAASPAQSVRGSTNHDAQEPAAVLYNRHHFNCIHCIAAGRGERYSKRCTVGLALWTIYQSAHQATAAEGAPLAGKASAAGATPVGNTGGTNKFSGANHG